MRSWSLALLFSGMVLGDPGPVRCEPVAPVAPQPAAASTSQPAPAGPPGRPAATTASGHAPLTTPGLDRIELQVADRQEPAVCWVYRPAGYAPGQRPPLIVCLHGTDDTAEQMVAFWRERRMRFPAVIAAPQGLGKGWSSEDVPTIHATFEYLANCVWHDSSRVLLAGFSAGGVMTFQMLYHEKAPATAAAALANYVPPRLTLEEVRDRRQIPVFYAVGMTDINHELMRTGLDFLRSAGANVELYRPAIGHTLDAGVAQAAVDWFFDQCEKQTDATIQSAARASAIGPAVLDLERIVAQPNWHAARQVEQASAVLKKLEQPGIELMQRADRLVSDQPGEAVELYEQVETTYGASRLGMEARRERERLQADPLVRYKIQQFVADKRAAQAMAEYAQAQRLVAQHRLTEAADLCRRITELYAETPAAPRAERLLVLLNGRTRP